MTVSERLELLMQRAADGELSIDQRHELMELVKYQPNGWKQLACTFLEEQLVGQNIRQAPPLSPPPEKSVVEPARRPIGFWYHHPSLTTAVTICLAFGLGLTVARERDSSADQVKSVPLVTDPVGTGQVDVDSRQHDSSIDVELRQQLADLLRELETFNGPLSGQR